MSALPQRIVRLRAAADGESFFEETQLDLFRQDFVPPAEPFSVSTPWPAESFVVADLPRGWGGAEPHPTPGRQLLFCLSGRFRTIASNGEAREFGPGDTVLFEDGHGKGHSSEVLSEEPVRAVLIRLP
jgi:hypothetical protein